MYIRQEYYASCTRSDDFVTTIPPPPTQGYGRGPFVEEIRDILVYIEK